MAGLQFTDVSTEFLNALRKWLAQLSAPAVPSSAEARTDSPFNLDARFQGRNRLRVRPPEPMVETPPRPEFGLNFGQSLDSGTPQNEAAQASTVVK